MKRILHTLLVFPGFFLPVAVNSQPDSCYQAITLTLCTPVTINNATATSTGDDAFLPGAICAASLDRTVWFTFTAPAAGLYQVILTPVGCTGTGLLEAGVLTGSCGGPFVSAACQWGTPPAPIVFNAATAQTFFVVVDGASDTCQFTIEVCGECSASFTPDVTTGNWPLTVNFTNTSQGTLFYSWDFGISGEGSTDSDPVFTYDNPGTYTVTLVAYTLNCQDTVTATLLVSGPSDVQVPNVFSPNGDGVNDVWRPVKHGLAQLEVRIFNRHGALVYSWTGLEGVWDGHTTLAGSTVPEGGYFYVLHATGYDGKIFDLHGMITLLR